LGSKSNKERALREIPVYTPPASLLPQLGLALATMLIGVCGSICAGKHTTAEFLVQQHGFLRLHLPTLAQVQHPNSLNGHKNSLLAGTTDSRRLDELRLLPSVTDQVGTRGLSFPDVDALLEFVTKRWREHWVITDIHDETTLELLLRRPFFLLLNVDAPVGLRFQRLNER
jgi:dCMP deaminase